MKIIQFPTRETAADLAFGQLLASLDAAINGVNGAATALSSPALATGMRGDVVNHLRTAAEALKLANQEMARHYHSGTCGLAPGELSRPA